VDSRGRRRAHDLRRWTPVDAVDGPPRSTDHKVPAVPHGQASRQQRALLPGRVG